MKNNQLYIVQQDGLSCKAKNTVTHHKKSYRAYRKAYKDFEANNPILPLTTYQEPGKEIRGEKVEQFWFEKNGKGIWVTFPAGATSYDLELDAKTRGAIQPITHVSDNYQPVDFTEFQVQLRCCLIIKDGFDNEWMQDFYADYKEDFGVKLSVKEWAEDFFQDVSLETHSYCLVSKVSKPLTPTAEVKQDEAKETSNIDFNDSNLLNPDNHDVGDPIKNYHGKPDHYNYSDIQKASKVFAENIDHHSDFIKLELRTAFTAGANWQKQQDAVKSEYGEKKS